MSERAKNRTKWTCIEPASIDRLNKEMDELVRNTLGSNLRELTRDEQRLLYNTMMESAVHISRRLLPQLDGEALVRAEAHMDQLQALAGRLRFAFIWVTKVGQ